jgi:1-acyl-sn-glycerol-3-phosphate acyltransferase
MIKKLFFLFIAKPFILFFIGLNKRGADLPKNGPAIIVANHNSHLDTIVLLGLFPIKRLPHVRPIAAADYFLINKWVAWFSSKVIGIVSISRNRENPELDPLAPCYHALERNEILILFPEGSRGNPEQRTRLKKGVAYMAKKYPTVPIIPVFLYGLGKSLPKGDVVPIPFFCDVIIGQANYGKEDIRQFMQELEKEFILLANQANILDDYDT